MDNNTILVEAVIYSAGKRGVTRDTIIERSGLSPEEVEYAIYAIREKYPNDGTSGIVFNDYGDLLSISTYGKIGDKVADILLKDKQKELSDTLLETLAIIAYQGPITRAEIEDIRGRSCDYAISVLMSAGLIYVSGKRSTVGNPREYSTTDEFLLRFELNSIYELKDKTNINNKLDAVRAQVEKENLFQELPDDYEQTLLSEEAEFISEEDDDESLLGAGEADTLDDDFEEAEEEVSDLDDYSSDDE